MLHKKHFVSTYLSSCGLYLNLTTRFWTFAQRWEPVIYGSSTETEEFSFLIYETNPGAISLLPNSDQGTVLSEFQQ